MSYLEQYLKENIEMEWLEAYEKSLQKHIEAVRQAGKQIGVSALQLEMHDLSKYSLEEFPHYARQFHGDAGDPDGFARAWLHHLHTNLHHWQYFIFPDDYQLKGSSIEEGGVMEMPEHYALEMVADWIGSSVVYTGSDDMGEWLVKNAPKIVLHNKTSSYVQAILVELGYRHVVFKREQDRYDRIQSGW